MSFECGLQGLLVREKLTMTRYFMWSDAELGFVEVSQETFEQESGEDRGLVNNKFLARSIDEGDCVSWFYDVSFGNVAGAVLAEFIKAVSSIQGKFVIPINIEK
jgi:hypothetical protein